MSEGVFLLIFGLSFGVPLIIGVILFGLAMDEHSKDLDKRKAFYDGLAKEREERERENGRKNH